MRVLGIDPGSVSGAWALLAPLQTPPLALCGDIPVSDRMVDGAGFARLVESLAPDVAVIEHVGPMPKQGVSSSFKFGRGVGTLHGVLAALRVPVVTVTPTLWKRSYALGSDKEKARALAIRLWPALPDLSRKKDHGRAEALLLARWHIDRTRV